MHLIVPCIQANRARNAIYKKWWVQDFQKGGGHILEVTNRAARISGCDREWRESKTARQNAGTNGL